MKWILVAGLCMILESQSCNKGEIKIPPCIQEKIDALEKQPKYNPPATVYRYLYRDKYVFLFSSDCCDQLNYLFDKDCHVICAPSGGITGNGDGKCSNFQQMASDKALIWKDDR